MPRVHLEHWDGFVSQVQRFYVARCITILSLTKGQLNRPNRQLLIFDPEEEFAARMSRGNLVSAIVTVAHPGASIGRCVEDFQLVAGMEQLQPLKPIRIDKASLIVLANI